ncbi:hypothetical protein CHS0354_020923 [Potamilus streckersoni]|uniref:Uncharacterized protein n=1 Tax=Potamilus streckersoni TaxID=2493646 RepID=A0AAE0SVC2_9BIVA|nr:hypothetical protein CHS0354_020923 [Potamilus streckersoni]
MHLEKKSDVDAQPPHGNANFSATNFFTDISGYGPCPLQHCEEMLRTGHCNNIAQFVYQNQYCRCDCNGLRKGVVQNEIPLRIIVEELRNGVAGGVLTREAMVAGIGSGVFGRRLSGNPIGMNANNGIRSGMIQHGLPLGGLGDTFQASIGNAAGGIEFPSRGGPGVNVGTGIDNGVPRKGLPLNSIILDIGGGTLNGPIDGGLSPIGLGGDLSTGIGQGIFERRVPAISIGEAGTGIVGRRGAVRNDIAERNVDGGIGIGIESGVAQSGLRRNFMRPAIRADLGSRQLGNNLPGNSIGVDVERGIISRRIGLGLPLDDIGIVGVGSGPGRMELPLNGGVEVAVGSGIGSEVIINGLPSNGVIVDDIGSGLSTRVAGSSLPFNGIGIDFRVGTGEAIDGRGFSTESIGSDFTSGIGHGIAERGIPAIGNREVETLIGSMEPGSGSPWNGIGGDVGDGLWSGVGASGLPVNAVGGNFGTVHSAHGSEWSQNANRANIGLGASGLPVNAVGGNFGTGTLHSAHGSEWSHNAIRANIGLGASGLPVNAVGGNFGTGIVHSALGSEWSQNSIRANFGLGIERAIFGGLIPGRAEFEYSPRWTFAPIINPTVLHTGNMFLKKKATYWKKPNFAKYPLRYFPKYYFKHTFRRRFF